MDLEHEFKRLDKNSDGVVTIDELFEGLQGRWEQDEIQDLFSAVDANSDGKITIEEFKAGWKKAVAAKRGPVPVLMGISGSGNTVPILGLIAESGCDCDFAPLDLAKGEHMTPEFLAMNPMHCAPTLKEGTDWSMWECRAILRYLCNKYRLREFYPTDPRERALIDNALDWNMSAMNPTIGYKMTYPFFGFSGPVSDEEYVAAGAKWEKELLPSLQKFLALSGGPLVGGAKVSIADFAIIGYLEPCTIVFPDGPVAKSETVKKYIQAFRAACPKHAEWFAPIKGFSESVAPKAKAAGR